MIDPRWDQRFFALAQHIATWSKDPSTQVGAVIVDSQRRVLGLGYNGFPRGVEDLPERLSDKPTKYKLVVHAEANAILNAGVSLDNCVLFATKSPCSDCVKLLIQAGIVGVVSPAPSLDEPWATDAAFSRLMLEEADIGWEHPQHGHVLSIVEG